MNIDPYLLGALENVLGKGYRRARGNVAFHCPFCSHRKPKLEINLDSDSPHFGYWECWVCGEKGRSIKSLIKHLNLSAVETHEILQFVKQNSNGKYVVPKNFVRLPDEFIALSVAPIDSYEANRYKQYLYRRGLTDNDFIKYNIGYCTSGKYRERVIIPSYDANNVLNFFVARSIDANAYIKSLNPEVSRDDIVPFENLINWNESIIICEGAFDAFACRRNSIPLFGKQISSALMKKILENPVPEIYVCLDQDALKAALRHCETFLNMGKKVYLVRPQEKDPSDEGFVNFTRQLQQAKELTFSDIVRYRLEI